MKVVTSADELAKEDEKKRMKRAECRSDRTISATELCQIVPSTIPFAHSVPFVRM